MIMVGSYPAPSWVLALSFLNNPKETSPFQDIRVREAVSLAVDLEGITKKVHFLSYMPWTYNTTPEIQKAIMDGTAAILDEDEKAAGVKISKAIRESRNKALLWANSIPYGLGPRIEYWEP